GGRHLLLIWQQYVPRFAKHAEMNVRSMTTNTARNVQRLVSSVQKRVRKSPKTKSLIEAVPYQNYYSGMALLFLSFRLASKLKAFSNVHALHLHHYSGS